MSILSGMGFMLYPLPASKQLPLPTATHADMLMFYDGSLLLSEDYFNENSTLFADVIPTKEKLGGKYPCDILFNCFVIDNILFGKIDALSDKIKNKYENRVNLKQGYAKCSSLILGNAVITADTNIYNKVTQSGFEALKISGGNILLPGYDCGFIGGASAVLDNTVFFFGDITKHPDYAKIKDFISSRGLSLCYDKSYPLTDFGGAVIT